ncbi:MAG: type IX secretion system membrane protein PorP/SprF, partial [Bacteroidales bacterium]|nr:type IX secretion system membrane protein PorP/SprF [Bacteroidales bacterium]
MTGMHSFRIIKRVCTVLCLAACSAFAHAQDMHLSQLYSNPLYLNPAFAGTSGCGRISAAYRNQWPNVGG